MRMPWTKTAAGQLDLVEEVGEGEFDLPDATVDAKAAEAAPDPLDRELSLDALTSNGMPLLVAADLLDEDPCNPRTEFPEGEIAELARDIALRGILQPIVVRLAAQAGRYRVLFGAKRLRAARKAGLQLVPVVIGSRAHDPYAQVAENQKRHGLTPLDLAKFMRSRADAGDSNAEIAKRRG